jgi:hypothetical protein
MHQTTSPRFLADNGATDTIVNGDYLHLVQNFEDITGDIIGANGVKVGAVFGTGFINFFGERIRVYAANTTTSVLSIGQTARAHHLEWIIRGETMTIVNRRTNDGHTLPISTENLYPLPPELFDPIHPTTAGSTASIETPRATGISTPSRTPPRNHPIQKEVLDTTPPSPPHPFSSPQVHTVSGDVSETIDKRRKKKRRYIEDADDVPDLLSDDDDEDDDDTTWYKTPTNNLPKNPTETQRNTYANTRLTEQMLWHSRLGHPNNRRMREMAKNPMYIERGFPALTPRQLDMKAVCDSCRIGKSTKKTSHKTIDKDTYLKGQCWSIDLTGRKDTPALGNGAVLGVVLVEHTTRYSVTYTIQNNDAQSILKVLRQWNTEYLSLVKSWYKISNPDLVYFMTSDNLEIDYTAVHNYLTSIGVRSKFTAPGSSSSNGIAERMIRTLDEGQRVLRIQKSLPDEFWGLAFHHSSFLRNRLMFTHRGQLQNDPYTLFYGHTFDYSYLRIFGSTCWAYDRTVTKSSAPRAHQGIFIGFKPNSNAYLVYVLSEGKIISSGDVTFDEPRVDSLTPQQPPTESSFSPPPPIAPLNLSALSNEEFIKAAGPNIQLPEQDFQRG